MDLNISSQDSSCFHLPHPLFDLASERFITNLITAIINIVTAPFSFIANMLIIIAIFDCPRLQTPSNLLLATLALSDAFVGLTVQPGYITYRLMEKSASFSSLFCKTYLQLCILRMFWCFFHDSNRCEL